MTQDPRLPQPYLPAKDPTLAAILSLIIPGAGQFYAGAAIKGVLFMVGAVVSGLLTLMCIGWFFLIPIWIFAPIDAHGSARAFNRSQGYPG